MKRIIKKKQKSEPELTKPKTESKNEKQIQE